MKKILSLFLMMGVLLTSSISFAADTTAPVISYLSHRNNSIIEKGTVINITAQEVDGTLAYIAYGWKSGDNYISSNEFAVTGKSYTVSTTAPLAAGTYTFVFRAENTDGLYTPWNTFVYTVKEDTVHTHSYGAWNSNATYHWRLCTTCGETVVANTTHSFSTAGSCTVCGYVKEVIDTTAPRITYISHSNGAVMLEGTKLTVKIEEAESELSNLAYGWKNLATNSYGNNWFEKSISGNNYTIETNAPAAGSYKFVVRMENTANINSGWIEYAYTVNAQSNHNHTYGAWQSNSNYHYLVCLTCSTTSNEAKHTFSNNVCTVCGYSKAVVNIDNETEIDVSPKSGSDLEYGDKVTIEAYDKDGVDYIEYYWNDNDDDTDKAYKEEVSVKVPSEEGKNYLYVRVKDENGNITDYERFVYYIEENYYPGDADGDGDLNPAVKELRVEIGNYEDRLVYEPDEEIKYYINYYNGSSSKASSVKVEVELPDYFKGVSASDDGSIKSGKITWNLGTLAAKEDGRLTFKVQCTTEKYNEMKFEMPVTIYQSSKEKDSSFTVNMIYNEDVDKSGTHESYCTGYPDGTFRPEGQITRAELASMIANMLGYQQGSYYRNGFIDVPSNHWAAGYIQFCVDNGYMSGYNYNTFAPSEPATRAMLADAIAKVLEVDDIEPIYLKANDTKNHPAGNSMEQLIRLNYIEGYSNGSSGINNLITRAEAVTIINKYLFRGELEVDNSNYYYGNYYNNGYYGNYYGNYYNNNYYYNYYYNYYNQVPQFVDLYTSHWAYGHIMEATCDHRYQRVVDGNEEMVD